MSSLKTRKKAPSRKKSAKEIAPLGYSDKLMAPISKTPKYAEKSTRHHRPFYDDYNVSKAHILQAVGDISDLDLFGRQCLVAVFVKPNITPGGVALPIREIKNDWWESKAVLLLKCGPDAFKGDNGYVQAMYDGRPPKPMEWLFANASAGLQTNICGEGASRPQGKDFHFNEMDLFEWDGWPCRIIPDDQFLGRLVKPHELI